MSVTIYAYRTLIWLSQQNREVIPVGMVPDEVLPPDEEDFTRDDMEKQGWLMPGEKTLGGDPDWTLSMEGHRQARRWTAKYPVHSAAHEILSALPDDRNDYLPGAEDAFDSSYRDPVLERPFTEAEIHKGAKLLHQQKQIAAEEFQGDILARLELTPKGEEVREDRHVPGLRVASAETSSRTEINTNISGGNFGAAQFGNNNASHVENVTFAVDQQFRELRELTESNANPDDRGELLEQIQRLEEAAKREDPAEFETLRNGFLSGFATKVGDKAVGALMAIAPALWG